MSAAPASTDVLDCAIAWAVKLESGTTGAQERAACVAWREAHPANEHAWQQVQRVEQTFRAVPAGALALRTLEAAAAPPHGHNAGRRRSLQLLALGVVGMATGLLALRLGPWQQRASYLTAVGEQQRQALDDGTELTLNTNTQAEVVFSPLRRMILLRQGEVLVDTGKDAGSLTGRRSFWVQTGQARLEAIGTRFTVRSIGDETRLHVIDGRVDVHPFGGGVTRVQAGQAVVVTDTHPVPQAQQDHSLDPEAWADGVLIAKQMRLDAFITELSRYQAAPLYCDERIAALRVSGVFQLNRPDAVGHALKALAAALPVTLRTTADGSLSLSPT